MHKAILHCRGFLCLILFQRHKIPKNKFPVNKLACKTDTLAHSERRKYRSYAKTLYASQAEERQTGCHCKAGDIEAYFYPRISHTCYV